MLLESISILTTAIYHLFVLVDLASCMYRRDEIPRASRGWFPRMGLKLVGGKHPRLATSLQVSRWYDDTTPEDARGAATPRAPGPVRPICDWGLLSPSLSKGPRFRFWSNLEPLNES